MMGKSIDAGQFVNQLIRKPKKQRFEHVFNFIQNQGVDFHKESLERVWHLYTSSLEIDYKIPTINTSIPITLVKATVQLLKNKQSDSALGWEKIINHLTVINSPGNHFSIVSEENSNNWLLASNTIKTTKI